MPTGDSRTEHCVLHRVLNGTSSEVVINSVTATEKVQEIRVGADWSLCYLRIDASLRQLFGDEHEADSRTQSCFTGTSNYFISIPRTASRENGAPVAVEPGPAPCHTNHAPPQAFPACGTSQHSPRKRAPRELSPDGRRSES
jgi:hypothetical protein